MSKKYYIIDFDSTFTQVEALDELARISLSSHPQRENIYKKIEDLTNLAMDGKLSFRESLAARVQLLEANREHLEKLVKHLKTQISASFKRNKHFFKHHGDDVLIVSGGFKEFITPVVAAFHIKKENIYANTFEFDETGTIVGFDSSNPLSEEGGKVKLLRLLQLQGEIHGIGDGYSDFQLKEHGMVKKFYAFTENIERRSVTEKADHITPSLDEFLFVNNLPTAISYPKNRIRCVLTDDVPDSVAKYLKKEGYTVKHAASLNDAELSDVSILITGEKENISETLLENAGRLKAIGFLGNGKKRLPLERCTAKGIIVFDGAQKPESVAKKITHFINNGDTLKSVNFPGIQLPRTSGGHRFVHICRNTQETMVRIGQAFASHNVKVSAQCLMANEQILYVITDISGEYGIDTLQALKRMEETLSFRVLF